VRHNPDRKEVLYRVVTQVSGQEIKQALSPAKTKIRPGGLRSLRAGGQRFKPA